MPDAAKRLASRAAAKLNGKVPVLPEVKYTNQYDASDPNRVRRPYVRRKKHGCHRKYIMEDGSLVPKFKVQHRQIAPGSFFVSVNGVLLAKTDTLHEAMEFAVRHDTQRGVACISWEFGRVRDRVGQKCGERVVLLRNTADDQSRGWRVSSEYDRRHVESIGLPRVFHRDPRRVGKVGRRSPHRHHACDTEHAAHWQETQRQQDSELRGDRDSPGQVPPDGDGAEGDV